MGCAPKCIFSLISISLTLFLFNSHLISTSFNPKFNNVVSTNHITSKFRSLLSLKTHNFTTKSHHFTPYLSPSPAPSQVLRKPVPATPFHVKVAPPTKASSHHAHITPPQSISNENKHGQGKTVAIITICVSLVLVMVICLGIFLLCKRHDSKNSQGKNKKVSFDPGPEIFYLNSLTHFVDIHDSNSNHAKVSSEMVQMERNIVSSSPCHSVNEEVIVRCEGDNESNFSVEETLSFHSARASDLSELVQNHLQPSNSPSNASYRSMSPMHKANFKTIRFVAPPFTEDQQADTFQASNSYDMIIPTISHPKNSFLSSKKSQFASTNVFMSHDSSDQSHVLTDLPKMHIHASSHPKPSFGYKTMQIPSESDTDKEISPPKFTFAPENASENTNFSASNHAPSNSTEIQLSAISSTKIQISKQNSVSNSTEVQSANVAPSKNGNIPKPPPPPPPPPPLPPRKNTTHQRACKDGRFQPPSPSRIKQMDQIENTKSTLPKLKPLHWDKVRAAPDRMMVWDKIKSSSFEFDETMMESLFGYNSKNVVKHEEANKSKSPSPSKHVLEHKRLQNITILLKALNATTQQVSNAITNGSGLSVQQLEALVKMAPTNEEEEKLVKYQDELEDLDPAEKFVKEVLRIPFAFAKIEVMLYKESFQDEVSHLSSSFAMLEDACNELKSSKLFLRLLEAVLKTGNRMNVGTTRGGARAFKLDALLKLADVKGRDGRTTLLHFVVQEINKPKPGEEKVDKEISGLDLVSGLSTELSNVRKTASVDLDVLMGSVQNLSLGLCKLKQLVQSHDSCVDELNLIFLQSMKAFIQIADKAIKELKNEEQQVLIHVREITEYYHGDLSKEEAPNPLRIFVIVRDFLGMLDRVCKESRQPKMHSGAPQLVMLSRKSIDKSISTD